MRKTFWLLLLCLMLFPLTVYGQGAPEQMNAALADLSSRVGHTVELNMVQQWFWEQANYPDTSMGCPKEGQMYAQEITLGYKFTIKYLDVTYDYRVNAAGTTVILCNEPDASGEPTATPDPNVTATPAAVDVNYLPPCPSPEADTMYQRIRLWPTIQARVAAGSANNVRDLPGTDNALVGEIPGGGIFDVMNGPECADGLVWWQINYDGLVGWTAEGDDSDYWLEPLPPRNLAANRIPITRETAGQIEEFSHFQSNVLSKLAFAPDTNVPPTQNVLGVLGNQGSEGVWIYDLNLIDEAPRILKGVALPMALDFSPVKSLVLTGDEAGWVRLFDMRADAVVEQALGLQAYQRNAMAVAFHPTNNTFAVAGKFVTNEAQVRENDIILYDFDKVVRTAYLAGHTADVTALTYRSDGALLVSGSLDNTVRIWDVSNGNELAKIAQTAGVLDMAFSPDQSVLAVALTDGTTVLWEVASQTQIATLTGHIGKVSGVAYSPDGSVIATVGAEDGSLRLWDSANGQALATFQVGEIAPVPLGSVAFSPDGTLIATGGDDRTIRLWAVSTSVG